MYNYVCIYLFIMLEMKGWNDVTLSPDSASKWQPTLLAGPPTPNTLVTSHAVLPQIGIRYTYSPCDMYESAPGVYVFDFCQNMAGIVTFKIPKGVAGSKYAGHIVRFGHGEALLGPPPAGVNTDHYGGVAPQKGSITLAGDGEAVEYTTKFTYYGFRYVQLTGYPGVPDFSSMTAHFLNTQYDLIGDISFSDPNLDRVQHITRAAAMSNFLSIPTDCPQRERRGWMGDAQLSSRTLVYNFGMAGSYTHFTTLIADAQDPTTGHVPDCVPWYNHGSGVSDPAWGSAFMFLTELIAEFYADDGIFGANYAQIKQYIDSLILETQSETDTFGGLLNYSHYGDWCPPAGCVQGGGPCRDSGLVSSFEYISQLRMLAKYAQILGYDDDAAKYSELDKNISASFVKAYYDPVNKIFYEPTIAQDNTLQTAISLASQIGLVPAADAAAVFQNLVDDVMVKHGGHLDTGIVGIKELLTALTSGGRIDVALHLAQVEDQPGWVYMVEQGATTLWETWTGSRYAPDASWNHIMFGSNSGWYFESLAGIQLYPGTRGFQRVLFKPSVWAAAASPPASICGNLSFVTASVNTIRGLATAKWQCGAGQLAKHTHQATGFRADSGLQFNYSVTVPLGSTASVVISTFGRSAADSALQVTEGDHATPIWTQGAYVPGVPGVTGAANQTDLGGEYVAVEVGSGDYNFQVYF